MSPENLAANRAAFAAVVGMSQPQPPESEGR